MPPKLSLTSTLALPSTAHTIPRLGLGVYQSPPQSCVQSCLTALQAGYRQIDTAQYYANESAVGTALRQASSTIPRSDVFVTTKILRTTNDGEAAYKACVQSLKKIDSREEGYVDLFLIHSPGKSKDKRKATWIALERLMKEGKSRTIGVSNYGVLQLEEMKDYATVWPPHVNQIELHPWCQQKETAAYCEKHGIVLQAYCPIVRNRKANDPTLLRLAKKHRMTTAQVLIRYSLQKGWVPLPKSDNPDRIRGNADVYGIELDDADMSALDSLDEGAKGSVVWFVG